LHQLAFPPALYEVSFFPTSLPTPVGGGVFDDGYSNRKGGILVWFGFTFPLWLEMVSIFFYVFCGHLNFFFF
jgi:hypothetical protein